MRPLSILELDYVSGADKYVSTNDFNVVGASTADMNKLSLSLQYLQNSSIASQALNEAIGTTVVIVHNGEDETLDDGTIHWDPDSALDLGNGNVQSAALGFLHEIGHDVEQDGHDKSADSQFDTVGDRIVITQLENPAADQLGEPTRSDHGGTDVNNSDPTYSHTPADDTGNGNGTDPYDSGQTGDGGSGDGGSGDGGDGGDGGNGGDGGDGDGDGDGGDGGYQGDEPDYD